MENGGLDDGSISGGGMYRPFGDPVTGSIVDGSENRECSEPCGESALSIFTECGACD